MTSAEEVQRIPSSIGARQAKLPATKEGPMQVFSFQQPGATSTGSISAPRLAKGLARGGVAQ
jgi:hypothetical protein